MEDIIDVSHFNLIFKLAYITNREVHTKARENNI